MLILILRLKIKNILLCRKVRKMDKRKGCKDFIKNKNKWYIWFLIFKLCGYKFLENKRVFFLLGEEFG